MKSIIGRKIGMTTVFAEDGQAYPVTVCEVLPNVVLQVKTKEKDGYEALQVGYEEKKEARSNKCELGVFKKANTTPKYIVRELKGDEIYGKFNVGDAIDCTIFNTGDMVDVVGLSKGHGFASVIKRYHFHIGPKGHGSGYHRHVGSLATNGRCNNRIHKGRKMPGHWGPKVRTILNLPIVKVDPEKNCVLIRGSVAGQKYSIIQIKSTVRSSKKPFEVSPIVDYSTSTQAEIELRNAQIQAAKAAAADTKALNPMKHSKKMTK